jgi:DNA polymerase-3 subunit alpha
MSEVLEETFGIMVYQEQVSRLVNRLGGIELKRAFRLAKAISKKKSRMIEAERRPFIEGAVGNGLEQTTAEQIFDDILRFGGYAFNKSHSTGYALVAFQTAYMKTYWPIEFMAALLTYEIPAAKPEDRGLYIDECRRMGIAIRPPDINESEADFTVVYEAPGEDPGHAESGDGKGPGERACIRFGLAGIKGVGESAVQTVLAARAEDGTFADIFDFCERVDTHRANRSTVEALIKAGAFDGTGAMRKALVEVLDSAMSGGADLQRDRRDGQMTMFESFQARHQGRSAKEIGDSEWSESEMLAHEKEALGFYVTSHPLTQYADVLQQFASADVIDLALPEFSDGTEVVLGGIITKMRTVITRGGRKPGAKMGIVTLEDLTGSIEVVLFPDDLEKYRPLIAADRVAFFRGQVDRRREEPSLRVTDVIPIEHGPIRLAQWVVVKLHCVATEERILQQVQTVCSKHKGRTPLFLQLTTPAGIQVSVRSDQPAGVKADASFVQDLAKLLSSDHVVIAGPPRRVPSRRAVPTGQTRRGASSAKPVHEKLAAGTSA